jgi:hypothetical protein
MADFASVLRRAVGNLEDNTEAAREAIYAKARKALRAQLEAMDPQLTAEEIDRQIARLDESVAEIEAQYKEPEAAEESETESEVSEPHESFQAAIEESVALGEATSNAARRARQTYEQLGTGPDDPSASSAHDGAPTSQTSVYDDDDDLADRGGSGRYIAWAILALVIVGIAGVAVWQRETVIEAMASLSSSEGDSDADGTKIADRVPATSEQTADSGQNAGSAEPSPSQNAAEAPKAETPPAAETAKAAEPAPTAPPSATAEGQRVAQALLIEESASGVTPASSLGGSVDWRLEDDAEAVGGTDKIIRGEVKIPEKDLALDLTIRRNQDKALPASHLIELVFVPGPQFKNGGVETIPGMLMKATPRSTGQPLVGAVVPVMDGYFLIGLSESDLDRDRNIQELTSRPFIDIPIAYKDGGRALLSLAKGESGEAVFDGAFQAWGQKPAP